MPPVYFWAFFVFFFEELFQLSRVKNSIIIIIITNFSLFNWHTSTRERTHTHTLATRYDR